jgi:hypothetical protein
MLKAWHKSKKKLHVQSTQTSRVDNFYFFQTSFFSTKYAPFFLKIGKYVFLTLKIMDFDIVALTKVIHIYLIEDMNAWYI